MYTVIQLYLFCSEVKIEAKYSFWLDQIVDGNTLTTVPFISLMTLIYKIQTLPKTRASFYLLSLAICFPHSPSAAQTTTTVDNSINQPFVSVLISIYPADGIAFQWFCLAACDESEDFFFFFVQKSNSLQVWWLCKVKWRFVAIKDKTKANCSSCSVSKLFSKNQYFQK